MAPTRKLAECWHFDQRLKHFGINEDVEGYVSGPLDVGFDLFWMFEYVDTSPEEGIG